jgi:hypothetical protein
MTGWRSATICARSARNPFGRFLNVFAGKSETMSSQTSPVPSNANTRRAPGCVQLLRSVASYFRHGDAEAGGWSVIDCVASAVPVGVSIDA